MNFWRRTIGSAVSRTASKKRGVPAFDRANAHLRIVMALIVMAYIVMAYIVMVFIVMA